MRPGKAYFGKARRGGIIIRQIFSENDRCVSAKLVAMRKEIGSMPVDIGNSSKLLEIMTDESALEKGDLEWALKKFIEAVHMPGVKLVDAFWLGILSPDTVMSKLHVEKGVFGQLLDCLFSLDTLQVQKISLFPYGQPEIEELHLSVELTPRR